MDRLTQIGTRMAMLIRRKHAALDELTRVQNELRELEDEVRRSTPGQLYGSRSASRIPDDAEDLITTQAIETSEQTVASAQSWHEEVRKMQADAGRNHHQSEYQSTPPDIAQTEAHASWPRF
jgi:hypothetical protein